MHHVALYRTRPNNCNLDDEIVITTWPQARQHRHLCAGFDLEHTHRLALADHVIDARVLGRHGRKREFPTTEFAYEFEAAPNRRQHAQAKYVDLKQSKILKVDLLPLDDRAIRHRRILNRHEIGERPIGDDKPADML